jgi:hypothetical protein
MTRRSKTLKKGGECSCSKTSFFNGGSDRGFINSATYNGGVPGYPYNSSVNNLSQPINSNSNVPSFIKGGKKRKSYKNYKNKQTLRRRKEKKYSSKRNKKVKRGGSSNLGAFGQYLNGASNYYTSNPMYIPVTNPMDNSTSPTISGNPAFRTF